jgi:hypothetical protein
MAYKKLVGTKNRHTSWITEVRLDDERTISAGEPVDLSAEDQKSLEERGFVFEDSSKEEATEAAENQQPVGADVGRAAPVFGSSVQPNQDAEEGDQPSGSKSK